MLYFRDVFNYAFDRAYALGKLQASGGQVNEPITLEEVEKAAEKYADRIKVPTSKYELIETKES